MQSIADRLTPPDRRRIVPVRLAEVPLSQRRQAALLAARQEADPYEAMRIKMFAEEPGDYVAWIAA